MASSLDGGWSWVIVLASFMAQLLAFGSPQSVGVLYPEWLNAFHEGKGTTAWVGSLVSGVALIAMCTNPCCIVCVVVFVVMVLGGSFCYIIACGGGSFVYLLTGMGCGLVYAATLTITCQYFDKRRGLALGIVTTGTSAGGFLYATAQNELIELFGLDGCLLIVGALALNLMACAGPMRPLNLPGYYLKQKAALDATESSAHKSPVKELLISMETGEPGAEPVCTQVVRVIKRRLRPQVEYLHTMGEYFQDRTFTAFCISLFLFSLGAFPPVLFMEDVAQSEGLIEHVAIIPLVSIVAMATGVGKLILGALVDMRWVSGLLLYALTVVGTGVALLLVPGWKSYLGLQVLSAALGFFSGNWSLTSYITTRIVGIERLSQAHGVLMCFGGFGIMLGPPVVGWFYDWTQSYNLAFYFSGCCVVLGGLILFLAALPCWDQREKARNVPEIDPDKQNPSDCDKVASVA
uniref:Solute carrier family 16 member 9a n=1 Tax=Astyanax mexicanus TaxID=7994 RepID=A0A8B9RMN6_ASTMX